MSLRNFGIGAVIPHKVGTKQASAASLTNRRHIDLLSPTSVGGIPDPVHGGVTIFRADSYSAFGSPAIRTAIRCQIHGTHDSRKEIFIMFR